MKELFIPSDYDGFMIAIHIYEVENAKGLVQIVHGMCEHKERYAHLCKFLNSLGFIAAISDNRGHGASTSEEFPLGYFGKNGKDALVEDQVTITNYLANSYNTQPILYAHSMGTIISRVYLQKHSDLISKVVLTGIPCYQSGARAGIFLSNLLTIFKGRKEKSKLLTNLVTGQFNKAVKEPISENEWISYNKENVKAYDSDELCGVPFTISGYKTLLQLVVQMHKKKHYEKTSPNLPILILVGKDDPCTGGEKGVAASLKTLKHTFHNVELKIFNEMRHEIINEEQFELVFDVIKEFIK